VLKTIKGDKQLGKLEVERCNLKMFGRRLGINYNDYIVVIEN
jgi:hypothetical protein